MTRIYFYYDEEGDYLEINIGKYSNGPLDDLGNGIFERIDEKESAVGINIVGFISKIKKQNEIRLPFLMNSDISISYDEEGDFLEIFLGKNTKCIATEIEPGIFIRKDEKSNELKSIEILNFKKITKNLEDIKINLPMEIVS